MRPCFDAQDINWACARELVCSSVPSPAASSTGVWMANDGRCREAVAANLFLACYTTACLHICRAALRLSRRIGGGRSPITRSCLQRWQGALRDSTPDPSLRRLQERGKGGPQTPPAAEAPSLAAENPSFKASQTQSGRNASRWKKAATSHFHGWKQVGRNFASLTSRSRHTSASSHCDTAGLGPCPRPAAVE
jgi:hypothetical protein